MIVNLISVNSSVPLFAGTFVDDDCELVDVDFLRFVDLVRLFPGRESYLNNLCFDCIYSMRDSNLEVLIYDMQY